ncbi:MAG: PA14 domain-containing protein [Verrucomicrobiales bacterium]|nr:PA14 domain-containing protein [Verrucomicrobiales bacterium]
MLFLNTALLLGALGIAIPIVIHLLNRRSNRIVEWGAMNFLLESLAIRNRRIQLEEALLMATRCLLVGLLALALARPFIPPGSSIPWVILLPLLLLAIVGIGVAVVLHDEPKWRRWIGLGSIALLVLCISLVVFEKYLNLSRFSPGAKQDIALIIDGSTSMSVLNDGDTNFYRAIEEARTLIKRAPRGHAFSLILGGPSPTGIILDPTTDRTELTGALDDLAPLDGAMATYEAFTLASLSLARGDNPAKQIVILTDEQNVGWEIGKSGRWNFLREAFRNLPSEPQIMLRRFPLPEFIRNLAVSEISLSREIIGVDRPVEVTVVVKNTGNEAVTPSSLTLTIDDGREYRDQSIGQLQPGERQSVTFDHQFSESGAHSLTAKLELEDDIGTDNHASFATNVADGLKVLIVDGRPSARPFDRASAFAAIALAPSSLTLDPTLEANNFSVSDEASDDFDMNYDPTLDLIRFLVDPLVIDAPDIGTIGDFSHFDVVLLGDVPRLPEKTATALADFTEKGGGLLITAGSQSQADFYNNWTIKEDQPFLPAVLTPTPVIASGGEEFSPSSQTLTHPALSKIADPANSDFASTVFTSYRKQTIPDTLSKETSVGARLNNGDILLSSREVGKGRIILLGTPLDLSSGNLVTRQSFLPFLHELVYHLADPAAYELNLDPGWEVNIALSGKGGRAIGEGLTGHYFSSPSNQDPAFSRNDDAIRFDWLNGSPAPGIPADNFRVEWTGSLQPPRSAQWHFSMELDDSFELWIDGERLGDFAGSDHRKTLKRKLEAGRWYDFRGVFRETTGNAKAILYWAADKEEREVISTDSFRSFDPPATAVTGTSELTTYQVSGPGGRMRTASLTSAGGASLLKLRGEISSGLYHLRVPEEQNPFFANFLRSDRQTIPFTVKRNAAESQLTKLTESDYTFLGNFITLSQPQTLEELIGFLNGNQFGEELWKYLALGALLFLLIETGLSRWIARSRRMGEEITIQFESKDSPTSAFHEQLVKMGKIKS